MGSFFNVITIRYNPDGGSLLGAEATRGRSYCDSCKRTLSWYELIPVFSFLFLRGKCRTCDKKILIQHPIVELVTGGIFVGVPLFFNSFFGIVNTNFFNFLSPWWYYVLVLVWIFVFCIWLLMVVIDLEHFIIPNGLNLLLFILGIIFVAIIVGYGDRMTLFYDSFIRHYALMFSPFQNPIYTHLLGMVAGGGFFLFLAFVTLGKGIGMGDIKLAAALGILLGWPDIILATMLAFIFGGLVSGVLVLVQKKHMKEKVPFAPFFILGALCTVFFGSILLQGYFAIFNL